MSFRNLQEILNKPKVLKIARIGEPVLLERASSVEDPGDPGIGQAIEDMKATLESFPSSTGLAAPQVRLSIRMIVVRNFQKMKGKDTRKAPLLEMINPSWTAISEETIEGWEGCLSIPNLKGKVFRYRSILVQYQSLDGTSYSLEAADAFARLIQHECDHLDGVLYLQRMTDLKHLAYMNVV